jgi:hypothetical protein
MGILKWDLRIRLHYFTLPAPTVAFSIRNRISEAVFLSMRFEVLTTGKFFLGCDAIYSCGCTYKTTQLHSVENHNPHIFKGFEFSVSKINL